MNKLLLTIVVTASTFVQASSELYTALGLAAQQDVQGAINHLQAHQKDEQDKEFLIQLERRFALQPLRAESPNTLYDRIFSIHTEYWRDVLMGSKTIEVANLALFFALSEISSIKLELEQQDNQYIVDQMEPITDALQKQLLDQENIHSMFGRTNGIQEFMAWRMQDTRKYNANLHDGNIEFDIEFLDGFLAYGWLGYATFDKATNGGWATKEKLFFVSSQYKLDSENFRIHYVHHEGRHFADYSKFPWITGAVLEYRAKLTQLWLSQEPALHLYMFKMAASLASINNAHGYGNWWVDERMDNWQSMSVQQINQEALRLLEESGTLLSEQRLDKEAFFNALPRDDTQQ